MIVFHRFSTHKFVISFLILIIFCQPGNNSRVNAESGTQTIGDPSNLPGGTYGAEFSGCGGEIVAVVNPDYEQQVVELVNNERISRGIPPLKLINQITDAARYHSSDLAQDNYFEHDTYDRVGGNLVYVCSTWDRIASFYNGARAENIAAGYSTPDLVMAAWMGSSGHRANILNPNYWEIGVGYYNGSGNYYHYWTQDFGKRSGIFPVIINNEASLTTDNLVSVYTYGIFTDMRLRNNNDPWSDWLPFSNYTTWELPPYSGEHTVHVEMRYSGITKSSSDSIYLSMPTHPVLGNLPDQISFRYNLYDHNFAPATALLTPQNVGSEQTLEWSVAKQGSWFDVTPDFGSTPQTITINPNVYTELEESVYTGLITVTVTSPLSVIGSPHVISLQLNVINTHTFQAFLPLLSSQN